MTKGPADQQQGPSAIHRLLSPFAAAAPGRRCLACCWRTCQSASRPIGLHDAGWLSWALSASQASSVSSCKTAEGASGKESALWKRGDPPGLPKEEIGIIRRSAHQGLLNANSSIDSPNARSSGVHAVPAAFSPLQQSRWRQYYPITPSLRGLVSCCYCCYCSI